jgi:hypothetical protein
MTKHLIRIVSLFILSTFLVSWGSKGHFIINNKCPESFPSSMIGFGVWADSLDIHGSDADNRKYYDKTESPKHFIDIDNYAEFNSTGRIASTYDSIVDLHDASTVIANGTLPWATKNMYDTLKADFQKLKWHKAMLHASDLGHYVADGHMPLHITANYDGKSTGQTGIHSRYETTMVGNYNTALANYTGEPVHLVSNVNNYVLNYIYANYQYLDSVLAADLYAKNLTGSTTSTAYYAALWSKSQFTTTLFHNASHALAELIYSAWMEAGSPAFGANSTVNYISPAMANNIAVYPNPTTGIVNLKGDNFLKTEVFTTTGAKVGEFYNNPIDLNRLPNGMYILKISEQDRLVKEEKLILSR